MKCLDKLPSDIRRDAGILTLEQAQGLYTITIYRAEGLVAGRRQGDYMDTALPEPKKPLSRIRRKTKKDS